MQKHISSRNHHLIPVELQNGFDQIPHSFGIFRRIRLIGGIWRVSVSGIRYFAADHPKPWQSIQSSSLCDTSPTCQRLFFLVLFLILFPILYLTVLVLVPTLRIRHPTESVWIFPLGRIFSNTDRLDVIPWMLFHGCYFMGSTQWW